jgi:histidyl-tRNA synthetase
MQKPNLPQGTRDFNAETLRKRNYIFNCIRKEFELYGFEPLETPAMENLETLMGKYGEEGDKLIFKLLNNGLDNPSKRDQAIADFEKILEGKNAKGISERALRYDLTIPFARYVAMHFGQLTLPYKRYQIQPVWRADRPQRGRYREFYQCDADIVGSHSLINDLEFANLYTGVFEKLHIDVEIKINNRKILYALGETCGTADKLTDITVAIDKLEKIGMEKVMEELVQKNFVSKQLSVIEKFLSIKGTNPEKLGALREIIADNKTGKKGMEELEFVLDAMGEASPSILTVDFTLARGLQYYTGVIFEVKAKNVQIGSIGGGGRYDDLTGLFGVPDIAGIGISFGVDRIFDVMEELKLFPENIHIGTAVLFFNLGDSESKTAFRLMQLLRNSGISCELYPETAKFDKQFRYADKKNIPYVIIIGSKEVDEKTCTVKNLKTGQQEIFQQSAITDFNFAR